jgi:hypothetical protein
LIFLDHNEPASGLLIDEMFCCDPSLYAETLLRYAKGIIDIKRHQKVLSTLDLVDLRGFVNGAN